MTRAFVARATSFFLPRPCDTSLESFTILSREYARTRSDRLQLYKSLVPSVSILLPLPDRQRHVFDPHAKAGERKPKSNVDDQERSLINDSTSPISSEQDQFTPPNNKPCRLDMSQHLTIGGDTAPAGGNKDTQPIPEKQFQPWDPTKPRKEC